jgi:hypothetical protein
MNLISWMKDAWADLRHGARLLRLNRGFFTFTVSALSLEFGVGANTAIFQLVDAIQGSIAKFGKQEGGRWNCV